MPTPNSWSFYGRRSELAQLRAILDRRRWFFLQISGRRRIGKTTLIQEALNTDERARTLYIQIPDSDPVGVIAACNGYLETFGMSDRVSDLADLAKLIGRLAETGRLRYTLVEEGELVAYKERSLAELGLDRFAKKVEFFQGDACNLKPVFSGYDLILAANLIDRLYSPARFLETVHERLNPGGLLLIASPYTWLAEHTKREEWIGGFKKDGENFSTLDGLKAMLGKHFRLRG